MAATNVTLAAETASDGLAEFIPGLEAAVKAAAKIELPEPADYHVSGSATFPATGLICLANATGLKLQAAAPLNEYH